MPGTETVSRNNCPPSSQDGLLPVTDWLAVVIKSVPRSLSPKAQLVTYRAGIEMRSSTLPAVE